MVRAEHDLREARAMDSAMAADEGEASLLSHPDALSRYLWACVLVARRRRELATRVSDEMYKRHDLIRGQHKWLRAR
jgi:hypothetical protein